MTICSCSLSYGTAEISVPRSASAPQNRSPPPLTKASCGFGGPPPSSVLTRESGTISHNNKTLLGTDTSKTSTAPIWNQNRAAKSDLVRPDTAATLYFYRFLSIYSLSDENPTFHKLTQTNRTLSWALLQDPVLGALLGALAAAFEPPFRGFSESFIGISHLASMALPLWVVTVLLCCAARGCLGQTSAFWNVEITYADSTCTEPNAKSWYARPVGSCTGSWAYATTGCIRETIGAVKRFCGALPQLGAGVVADEYNNTDTARSCNAVGYVGKAFNRNGCFPAGFLTPFLRTTCVGGSYTVVGCTSCTTSDADCSLQVPIATQYVPDDTCRAYGGSTTSRSRAVCILAPPGTSSTGSESIARLSLVLTAAVLLLLSSFTVVLL